MKIMKFEIYICSNYVSFPLFKSQLLATINTKIYVTLGKSMSHAN